MLSGLMVCLVIVFFAFNPVLLHANVQDDRLIEGAVMGTTPEGTIQTIDAITPLIPAKYQVNADLQTLLYEPMLRIGQNGEIRYQLAQEIKPYSPTSEGVDYIITLRNDVFWHDGTRFTADDVVATFKKIVELASDDLADNKVVANRAEALSQMTIIKLEDFKIQIYVTQANSSSKSLFPNFLELITFKIMPAKYLAQVNPYTVTSNDPLINRKPTGTGPFRFESGNEDRIILNRFDSYYGSKSEIKKIEFRLFKNEDALVNALKNGEIHSFVSSTSKHERDLDRYPKIQQYLSDVLTNQYWAVYFNTQSGADYIKDPKLRRALAAAINYEYLLQSILDRGERAFGPISSKSNYFNKDAGWVKYDPTVAKSELEKLGWTYNAQQKLTKDGKPLLIKLNYVDNYDRAKVIESIRQDWEAIGVTVETQEYPLSQFKEEVLLGSFDSIMYGMNTFTDPDRYELFHSSEIVPPDLNISGYQSPDTTSKIVDKKLVKVSKSDLDLEIGRGTLDYKLRKQVYDEFQTLIARDQPVIFLYHPIYSYYASTALTGVSLTSVSTMEDRFLSIAGWTVE
jgi:peptide/nickel transport system substrate-binding protein